MANFDIGLSGLFAAQKAFDIIGNNIANAATEGYHRQRIELAPAYFSQFGSILLGGGVEVAEITRAIDNLLEQEILRQKASLEHVSQECSTLQTVENAFGELMTGGGLNAAIENFFNALQDLSVNPGETNQVVTSAEALAGQFRTLGDFLTTLEQQIQLEAENTVEHINRLINQITELNDKIESTEIGGGQANNLRDQRDQRVAELSELIGVEILNREHGVVDVTASGIPVAISTFATELDIDLQEDGKLGITAAGAHDYITDVQGGRLGGLLSLKNELVSDIHDNLDNLAKAIIQQVNQYHVQGVGSAGSFTQLTGWPMASENLADFDPPVTDGKIYIRVTNTGTGEITRNEIDIDASADSLSSIAADIIAITGLNASVTSSRLQITADTNYTFDFLPAVLPEPTVNNLIGSPPTTPPPTISVSGIYTGPDNDTFEFTVQGTGSVGNGALNLEVRDNGGAGDPPIATLNVGDGYSARDPLDIGNGIKVSLSDGYLNDGETFEVDAFADTDTSGVLAAIGLNTFFSGSGASDMALCADIAAEPDRVATALGGDMTDNTNAQVLAGLRDQAVSSLNDMTPGDFYRRMIANTGQELAVKQMRQDNISNMVRNLASQQGDISGVNINDEAARLLIFEQMFQAMAKYVNVIQTTIASIMEIM